MWSKGHMPKDKNVIRRRLESTTLDITQSVPCSIHELENLIPFCLSNGQKYQNEWKWKWNLKYLLYKPILEIK
jgi:hypothetical protein